MKKGDMEEQILRASKEIVVKFIEVGRLSPSNFAETFKVVHRAIKETVKEDTAAGGQDKGAGIPSGAAQK